MRLPKWRPLTWVIVVIDLLFLIWIIAASASNSGESCVGDYADACKAGGQVGKGIAIVLIIFFAAAVNVILGVIWLVTRKSRRDMPVPAPAPVARRCPFCAEPIQVEAIVCRHCGRDLPRARATPTQ